HMAWPRAAAATLLSFMLELACASPADPPPAPPVCDASLPDESACSSGVPSFANDVAPLVNRSCLDCHFAGNRNSTVVLETAAQFAKKQALVEGQLYDC